MPRFALKTTGFGGRLQAVSRGAVCGHPCERIRECLKRSEQTTASRRTEVVLVSQGGTMTI